MSVKLINEGSLADRTKFYIDNRLLFISICLLNYLVIYLGDTFVFTEEFYLELLKKEQLSNPEISRIKQFNTDMGWIIDALMPLFLLIKFSLISASIYLVMYFKDISVSFGKIMRAAIIAEIILIIAAAIRIFWLSKIPEIDTFYYKTFYPLSLVNIVGDSVLIKSTWAIPLFKSINLFQLIYVLVLTFCLSKFLNKGFIRMLLIVLSCCLLLYILYNGAFMFVTMTN